MIQPNQIIKNRYRVIRKIGEGGFGKVWEVEEKGTRKVMKVMGSFCSQKHIDLFQQEAKILQQLNHPRIPKVASDGYFMWNDETNIYHCLIMEKIAGDNLEKWLKKTGKKVINETLVINWLKQLLEILDYLHKQGYIHRDIKPNNIMVKPNLDLVLIDFGAARKINYTYFAKINDGQLTKVYTDSYAPLEQIKGKVVPQSDFFALGRTLVFLLTRKEPMTLPEDEITGDLIWRNSAENVSKKLADMIDWLMATFPKGRPKNVQVIWQKLAEIENVSQSRNEKNIGVIFSWFSENTRVSPPSENTKDFHRTKPKSLGAKIAIALSVIFGMGSFWLASPQLAVGINDRGYDKYYNENLEFAKFYFHLALLLNPEYGKAHYNLGAVYQRKGNISQARFLWEKAINLTGLDKAYYKLGILEFEQGKHERAFTLFKQGLEISQDEEVKKDIFNELRKLMIEYPGFVESDRFCLLVNDFPNYMEDMLIKKELEKCQKVVGMLNLTSLF